MQTVVGPYCSKNRDRFLRFGRFLFWAKFRPILQQYFGFLQIWNQMKGRKKILKKKKNREEEEEEAKEEEDNEEEGKKQK